MSATVVDVPLASAADDAGQVIVREFLHLRNAGTREWATFPEQPDAASLNVTFVATATPDETTLLIRQDDVKEAWRVRLNDRDLGPLHRDENDMLTGWPVPGRVLRDGENSLTISLPPTAKPDDIRVGEIQLIKTARKDFFNGASLQVEIRDADSGELIPARITLQNEDGTLQDTGAASNDHLAVRPGIVYSGSGEATIPVRPGRYRVTAGRGFEYSLAQAEVELQRGAARLVKLQLRREVPTHGYAACDTHVHTLTHSGHGDATVQERMLTLAAEGIELPIATDHNVHIDHEPFAREMQVRKYFTPVIGNEFTTKVGHFNVFPIERDAPVGNHRLEDWAEIFPEIDRVRGVKAVILNHARDLHSGVTPFGPLLFNDASGDNVRGWQLRANAMEVVNSSANQTDILQLFRDWMTLLNRGHQITPVGSSDSHDVARHFVGQGRTYIRCEDRDPGAIDAEEAVSNFVQGRVMVSFGLLAELEVNGRYRSGEIVRVSGNTVSVTIRVLAPHWIQASEVQLYANGELIRTESIGQPAADLPTGVKWQSEWVIPAPPHDAFLTVIATGPGIGDSRWRTAKPYQPDSPEWTPAWIGCSGAVWLDVDGDGRGASARELARPIVARSQDLTELLDALRNYDSAVAVQAAALYQSNGHSLTDSESSAAILKASEPVRNGFQRYLAAWRRNQIATAEQ